MTSASDLDLAALPDSLFSGLEPEQDTRQRLIYAGLEIFGAYNLEGATTRQIAQKAGVNQAAIAYHFGGKDGLYLAVVEAAISTAKANILPAATAIQQRDPANRFSSREALELAQGIVHAFLGMLVRFPIAASWARIMVREQMQPTKAFDYIYENLIQYINKGFARLLADTLGTAPDEPQVMLRAHALVGQFLIFLAGRETIWRRMSWTGYTAVEAQQIEQAISANLEAIFLCEMDLPKKGGAQ